MLYFLTTNVIVCPDHKRNRITMPHHFFIIPVLILTLCECIHGSIINSRLVISCHKYHSRFIYIFEIFHHIFKSIIWQFNQAQICFYVFCFYVFKWNCLGIIFIIPADKRAVILHCHDISKIRIIWILLIAFKIFNDTLIRTCICSIMSQFFYRSRYRIIIVEVFKSK